MEESLRFGEKGPEDKRPKDLVGKLKNENSNSSYQCNCVISPKLGCNCWPNR